MQIPFSLPGAPSQNGQLGHKNINNGGAGDSFGNSMLSRDIAPQSCLGELGGLDAHWCGGGMKAAWEGDVARFASALALALA